MIKLTMVCNQCEATFRGGMTVNDLKLNATLAGWHIKNTGDFCPGCAGGTIQASQHEAGTGGNPSEKSPGEATV